MVPDTTLPLSSGYIQRAKESCRSRAQSDRWGSTRTTPRTCWRCASDRSMTAVGVHTRSPLSAALAGVKTF